MNSSAGKTEVLGFHKARGAGLGAIKSVVSAKEGGDESVGMTAMNELLDFAVVSASGNCLA
jgi:hypothetical protein